MSCPRCLALEDCIEELLDCIRVYSPEYMHGISTKSLVRDAESVITEKPSGRLDLLTTEEVLAGVHEPEWRELAKPVA